MDPSLISAGVQAVSGLAQGVTGFFQNAEAKRIMAKNPRPKYYIPKEVMDNQRLAESKAGQGMSDSARNTYIQETERGLTSSLETILKGGGSVNNIADLYDNYSSGIAKMSILDDEMRAANIRNMISQNNELSSYKDKEWQVNVFAPYADKAQAAAALKKQGSDNIWKGINTIGSAVSNYATGEMYEDQSNSVFGSSSPTPTPATSTDPIPTPTPTIPIQAGQNFFPPNAANMSGNFNWYMPGMGDPVPVMPQPQIQPTPYESIQLKYPGLMYGNLFFQKR